MGGFTAASIIELVKVIGYPAVIFVIWYMTIKFFEVFLTKQDDKTMKIIETQEKRNQENFQVLNKFAESIDYMAGQISNVNTKMDNNLFCPIVKKGTGER